MGRRNATTFKKRQRELAKKEKKEAKLEMRKQRKEGLSEETADGVPIDPDLDTFEDPHALRLDTDPIQPV